MITLAEVEKLGRVHTVEPWGTAALPVPDLIEEMVSKTLEDGGQVLVVQDAPGGIAVKMPSSPNG